VPELRIITDTPLSYDDGTRASLPEPHLYPNDTALIQYSSGSTGDPKGCVLSHRAVCRNARAWIEAFDYKRGEATLNWMPLFHDFGLMLSVIAPIIGQLSCILLRTRAFVSDPAAWLRGMTGCGPVHTAASASALELVHVRNRHKSAASFDLSDVRSIICAAEPIQPDVVERFLQLGRRYGLSPRSFYAGYGMSETTVMAAAKRGLTVDRVHRDSGRQTGALQIPTTDPDHVAQYVSLGPAAPGTEFQIVDDQGISLPERCMGHLVLRSESLMDGYLKDPQATAAVLHDGWLKTGDIGYLADAEFHFVARQKDLIVIGGQKIVPADIDVAVGMALEIPIQRVASFGFAGSGATEAIGIAIETRDSNPMHFEGAVRAACYEQTGFQPALIVACPIGTIPKTSSGKKRRAAVRMTVVNSSDTTVITS